VTIRRFVALGDSFTEGLEDELGPSGRHLGWADRVAAGLAKRDGQVRYANLAVRGRVLADVVADQIPAALALGADLVSFHAGANDLLRPRGVAVDVLLHSYDAAVGRLVADDRDVVLFTVIERVGGTGRTADRLAARFAAFNRGVRAAASRHGCLLVDAAAVPGLQDRRLWHEDRLHLGPEGHARIAAAVMEQLGVTDPGLIGGPAGWWREPLAQGARPRRRAELAADVRWVRLHLLPWVGRRIRRVSSGDTVPPKHLELVEVRADSSG
jgi:lysophospholipase L1-like esterase